MADPHFGVESEAEHWTEYEVAGWLHRSGYQYATKRFFDAQIDGNVLLHDVTASMLVNQLGINQLHKNRFMRCLDAMRRRVLRPSAGPLVLDFSVFAVDIPAEHSQHEAEVAALRKTHCVLMGSEGLSVEEAQREWASRWRAS